MAKKFQALKFELELESDLKFLADLKNQSYNEYVEGILSRHVMIQRRAIREIHDRALQRDEFPVDGPVGGSVVNGG